MILFPSTPRIISIAVLVLLEPLLPVSTADPELVASEFTAALAGEVDAVSVAVASVMILVWVGDRCVQCLTKHNSWRNEFNKPQATASDADVEVVVGWKPLSPIC